jgi:23S rRNA (uracil1939-C5)-methyltransferase
LCGGCHWQHIDYQAQLRFKRQVLCSQLERIGKQEKPIVHAAIGMKNPWAYRNHVRLGVDRLGQVGYYAPKSRDIVPVDECLIAHPLLNELWGALDLQCEGLRHISLRAGVNTGEQMLILEGDSESMPELGLDMPISCLYQYGRGGIAVMAGSSYYHERLDNRTFRVSGPSFFQVNTQQAQCLIETVRAFLSLQPQDVLLDAYCGVGTFALLLAPDVKRVLGIESSLWAIEDALINGSREEVEFLQGGIAEVLSNPDFSCGAVVLDPPRSGCTADALRALTLCDPSRIVYVSCDPATLARDVAALASLGYVLVEVQPIDMVPQTYHVESVSLLRRD